MPNLVELALSPWGYALIGIIPIVVILLVTRHARMVPRDPGSGHAGCPDWRVTKDILVFGGASAYTFGIQYFLAAWLIGTSSTFGEYLMVFGTLQAVLASIQSLTYLLQAPRSNASTIYLKSHLNGCGYTTAWSPFWPLYWLGKIPGLGSIVGVIRDILTIVDYVFSLPALLLLSLATKLLLGKWTMPIVQPVDHPAH